MILIRCDKCKAEINEASVIRFITKAEKIMGDNSISTSNKTITDEIHLCPTCADKLFKEWMVK